MSSSRAAWMVAGTVGLVEALKDQGFARWNYSIRAIHHHAKSNVRSVSQTKKLSSQASMASSRGIEEKAKQAEESLRNVIEEKNTLPIHDKREDETGPRDPTCLGYMGVAVLNGHTDHGYKLRSLFRHGFTSIDHLRPFSSILGSDVNEDRKSTQVQSDDSLRQVIPNPLVSASRRVDLRKKVATFSPFTKFLNPVRPRQIPKTIGISSCFIPSIIWLSTYLYPHSTISAFIKKTYHHSNIHSMSSTSRAWMVAGTVGLVEALKDQGYARWNYTIRTIHHHAKSNLRSVSQTKKLSSPAALASTGSIEEKAKQSEESLRKVMYLSCWGPN
ncbi:hypothetical protein L1987_72651 [Smallanthus sonchifolius]|uniref:Uncharacterized protein n=1 Tax=Smallanthus sonchifolius TaxID=185202 RepID=A0ACB9AWI2_9ASTR|nr:hypothetical protein L1987_72651 [Smallanthus sonchifolius]